MNLCFCIRRKKTKKIPNQINNNENNFSNREGYEVNGQPCVFPSYENIDNKKFYTHYYHPNPYSQFPGKYNSEYTIEQNEIINQNNYPSFSCAFFIILYFIIILILMLLCLY